MKSRSLFLLGLFAAGLWTAMAASSQAVSGQASTMPAAPGGSAAEQAAPLTGNQTMTLDVVVSDKSGQPVSGLQPTDFALLDNKQQRSLLAVRAANAAADPPAEIILVIDALNVNFTTVSNERQMIEDYLRRSGGQVALPTTLAILTGKGINIQDRPTRDAKSLAQYLDSNATYLRDVKQSAGVLGVVEQEQFSLKALHMLAQEESQRPGRKLVVWMSSGWHVVSNPNFPPSKNDSEGIYADIVSISRELREARTTLYSADVEGVGLLHSNYEAYLKGVNDPHRADLGDLMLLVLVTQSGGQILYGSNNLTSLIGKCVADANAYYVLMFEPPHSDRPMEYHAVEVRVAKPGLKARTRTGYYAEP